LEKKKKRNQKRKRKEGEEGKPVPHISKLSRTKEAATKTRIARSLLW